MANTAAANAIGRRQAPVLLLAASQGLVPIIAVDATTTRVQELKLSEMIMWHAGGPAMRLPLVLIECRLVYCY
jgi:hypothetical protein